MKGRDYFGDTGEDGRIILKLILKKQNKTEWSGFIWCRSWTSDGPL
jgi:hypothetical protein